MLVNSSESVSSAGAKKILGWFLEGLVLVVALWLVFFLAGRALRHVAIVQIAELTHTRIKARSIDFNLDGSVFIEKLILRPHREQKYDDAILKAERVYARFGIGSLLLLRPRLKEIHIDNFVFNAQHDLDTGQWNVAALKISPPKGGPGKVPLIRLEKGTLLYSKVSNSQIKVVAEIPLDARFGPTEETWRGYSFKVTTAERPGFGKSNLNGLWEPGKIVVTGGISSADIPAFERSWVINVLTAELNYDQSNAYSLKLRVRDLFGMHTPAGDASAFDRPAFLEKFGLFAALQRFFHRYQPEGQVNIDLEAVGNLERLSESTLNGEVRCKDVLICDRKFPYLMEHLTGQVEFTEKGVSLNNISGWHNDVKLFFNGWVKDFGPDWRYQVEMTSDNMNLDSDVYNALSEKQKKLWSAFSPSGPATIKYTFSRQPQTGKKNTLGVDLLGIEAKCRHFPYPLKNLTGRLLFDSDSITLSGLVSQWEGCKIDIGGKVTERRSERPIYDISIAAEDVPLDSTLAAALSDSQRFFYNRLNMDGLADAEVKVLTSKDNSGAANFTANVTLKNASLNVEDFPLVVSDISARAVITRDLIRVEDFTGLHSDGLLSLTGLIWPGTEEEKLRYCLSLNTEQTQLSDDLFGLLPASLGKIIAGLEPEGKINYTAHLNKAGGERCPDFAIDVDCLGVSAHLDPFKNPLKNITGRLTITEDGIEMGAFAANIAEDSFIMPITSSIKINGQITPSDGAFSSGWLVLAAEASKIKGKSFTNLQADLDYNQDSQSWVTERLIADGYGGRLIGKFEFKRPAEVTPGYLLEVGFYNVDLKQFLSDGEPEEATRNDYTSGKMSGSLSLAADLDDASSRIGRCRLKITDMQVGKLSPLAKLLQVLQLTEPEDYAFDQMLVDSYIKHDRLFVEKFDLSGKALAFNGSGWMDLRTQVVDLTLTARGRRVATAEPSIWQSLAEGLGIAVVRMDVDGYLYDPEVTTTTLPVIEATLQLLGTKPTGPNL
jgi:hypothetical protein